MDKKPYIVAVLIQLIYTGSIVISKAAFNGGMPTIVFVFYRQVFASSMCLVPSAIVFGREKTPNMSLPIFINIFFLALLGVAFSLNIFNLGIKYTSSTVTAAMTNALPVVTFAIAC
ncbi:hypothetical protein LUZ61_007334 [Rhynchospora tenuis]|uniref:WAT1-related protein n=1 Tax=Rhynchospora tenuis TaxID=198213 RepID=A0AAD6EWH0_9POAL|nr:hypothetical protein LUZ61_007334 [Rhynchospora tenuis]